MKKPILSLMVLFCTVTSVNAQQVLNGDFDKSGTLTVGDVTTLVEMVMGKREPMYIDTSTGMFEPDNTKLYGTWETADHESIVIFDETGAVYNNKKYSYQYYPNLTKLIFSDTEDGPAKVMLFVEKTSYSQIIRIFDNKVGDFVEYILSPEVVKVESITLVPTSLELNVDNTETIVATVLPENAHQKVNWSSSDETIATVDGEGKVAAIAEGTAIITCSATDGSEVFATCEVKVIPNAILVTDITLKPTSLELFIGKMARIEATVLPEDADNTEVIWSSSDKSVATVEKGLVKAVATGTAIISCMAKDKSGVSATCEVLVDYEYVDLGLERGTLWATCNVGAEDPADVGDYFAWGEIEPKEAYNWGNYIHCKGESTMQTKYCVNASYWGGEGEEPDGLTLLEPGDDAARQLWGDEWCMPTAEDLAELNECPRKEYATRQYNGQTVVGVEIYNRVYGHPSIFLPISGYINGTRLTNTDYGYYWSDGNSQNGNTTATTFQIVTEGERVTSMMTVTRNRCYGMPIRPVRREKIQR